ncbi:MAG: hypothetical protein IH955_04280 [Chloroflexi bacterium]|nr:hypothetical protein [Chloroflexota bacterium]
MKNRLLPVRDSADSLDKWEQDLAHIQLRIAGRWLDRSNKVKDLFARFFFYFAGFNAIYFLWSQIERQEGSASGSNGEGKQIRNLLQKFQEEKAVKILDTLSDSVKYFRDRRPIQDMRYRKDDSSHEGKEDEGRKWKRKLGGTSAPVEKLVALGMILYMVRSNLVHGSKSQEGDDLCVIMHSVNPMECLLAESIELTRQKLRMEI